MSLVNELLIRDAEIQVKAAKTSVEKIAAASAGTSRLVCHLHLTGGSGDGDDGDDVEGAAYPAPERP